LNEITSAVPRLLPGADMAAVAVVSSSGNLQITAAHGSPATFEAALHRTLEPPRWAAADQSQPGAVADRWPVSVTLDHCAEMGSLICVPLGSGAMMFGTLLVLGLRVDAFTPRTAADATTLAIHASIALAAHHHHTHLQHAVRSRDVIG
jgi:transcriptional regulator with GAF, ATPase, and Fis domain